MKHKKIICIIITILMIISVFPMQTFAAEEDPIILDSNFSKDKGACQALKQFVHK